MKRSVSGALFALTYAIAKAYFTYTPSTLDFVSTK